MSEASRRIDSVGTGGRPTNADEALERSSAVSWAAILAGAAGSAALSLLLMVLGTGLGFSAVSPWSMEGISATALGFAAIAWLSFTQLAASGMGGYLAGRLRKKWTAVHSSEVYFRDTAHGFLTWAVTSLLTVVLLTSVVGSIISGGLRASAAVAGGAASVVGTVAGSAAGSAATLGAGGVSSTIEYYVDSLFRDEPAGSAGAAAGQAPEAAQSDEEGAAATQVRELAREISEIPAGEVTRILVRALRTGTLPQEDERYIGQLIAQRTNLTQQQAEQRVSEGFSEVRSTLQEAKATAREVAEEAHEASAYGAFWMFVTLLIGAIAASLMAVVGGRQRDA